ncbi:MAG: hypothetical protein D6722_24420 [Bacteroidetes bacterium]|nr:MAG: hypothetical protein D6722_24420 [Bacteroidota bacterium]
MTTPPTLEAYRQDLWARLDQAITTPGAPFQTLALATTFDGQPEARLLVLRALDQQARRLTHYADRRSAKIAQLEAQPRVCWLGWDPGAQLQLRLYGSARLHLDDDRAREAWDSMPASSRLHYSGPHAAGTPIDDPAQAAFAAYGTHENPESAAWARNFALIDTEVDAIDLLHLDRAGHRRAHYQWDGTSWQARWVVP